MVLGPALFFLAFFFLLTYPAFSRFSTHFFADEGDGLQNVWNIWWVKEAVTVLHQGPWYTRFLHYPYGSSLLGHTLNPFNGFAGIALSTFLSQVAVHNAIVTFSFVAGGIGAFLLAYDLTASYWPSLIAGFIFTFSNFHFAHAEGHLQLVSLEWIPFFVLLWLKLLRKPTKTLGAGAALTLFLVILCDYYYFFYCTLFALISLCWFAVRDNGLAQLAHRRQLQAFAAFGLVALATSGVLAASLVLANFRDSWLGAHPAREFSLDLLAPFIYGGHWRFASLTRFYWSRLPGNIQESSVHLGLSVVVLLICAWRMRKSVELRELELFFFVLLVFSVLALGPALHLAGREILPRWVKLPYAWLGVVFPPLKFSGVPVRMMVMVMLSAAVLSAFALKLLLGGSRHQQAFALLLIAFGFIEYLPQPIPTSRVEIPEYVQELKALPNEGGVLDTAAKPSESLFYQTIHEKPLAFGYLSRLPTSVAAKDHQLEQTIRDQRLDRLARDYDLKYMVTMDSFETLRTWPGAKLLWSDGRLGLFDISRLLGPSASQP